MRSTTTCCMVYLPEEYILSRLAPSLKIKGSRVYQHYTSLWGGSGSVVHVVCLQTRRLVFQSPVPPDQVSRCP